MAIGERGERGGQALARPGSQRVRIESGHFCLLRCWRAKHARAHSWTDRDDPAGWAGRDLRQRHAAPDQVCDAVADNETSGGITA